MIKLTLRQCEYFLAISQQGGIAQASRVLNISQPAVSQAIEKLENLSGLRLFERHHAKGTELTPEGRAFLTSVSRLVKCAEQTELDAQAIKSHKAGIIRLGCFHTLAPFYLSQIISNYKETQPGVTITATEMRQDELLAALRKDELDLALAYDMSFISKGITSEVLAKLRPFIMLNDDHPLAGRSSIEMTELADEPYVMFDGPASREYFENLLASQGIDPVVSLKLHSMESVRSAVANAIGFSLGVMAPPNSNTYDGRKVVTVPISGEIESLPIVLASKKAEINSPLIESFVEFCHSQFSHPQSSGERV